MNNPATDCATPDMRSETYQVDVLHDAAYLGRHPARDIGADRMRIDTRPLGLHEGDFLLLEIHPPGTGMRRCREARVCTTDASGATLRLLPSRSLPSSARH